MEARTTLARLEYEFETGITFLKLNKQVVDANGKVLFSEPHRTPVAPGGSVEGQMTMVNANLETMGFPAVPTKDVALCSKIIEAARAPVVIVTK